MSFVVVTGIAFCCESDLREGRRLAHLGPAHVCGWGCGRRRWQSVGGRIDAFL